MNDFDFYKSIFDRELKRRFDLESVTNQPITLASITASILFFFATREEVGCLVWILILIGVVFWLLGLYAIAKASNNIFKGFHYKELPITSEVRSHQQQKNSKKNGCGDKYILDKMIELSDNHIKINDARSKNIHLAKKYIIATFVIEILISIIYVYKTTLL